jgi:conjugative transfer ATPase
LPKPASPQDGGGQPSGQPVHNPQARHGYGPKGDINPPGVERVAAMYRREPSFTNLLPWLDYAPETQTFLLSDGRGLGALFDIRPAGCEARPDEWLEGFRDKLQVALAALPEADPPWVVQFFVQDEPRLESLVDDIAAYVREDAKHSRFSEAWLAVLREHLGDICRPEGLFVDRLVTGAAWRGRRRRVRATLSRCPAGGEGSWAAAPEQELDDVAARFATALAAAGIVVRRCGGRELYEWMFRWFNPHPPTEDGDADAVLKAAPYPGDEADSRPFGYDFSEALMLGLPVADPDAGLWWFDDIPHRLISVQALSRAPLIGQLALERLIGDHRFAVLDRMPEHTVMVMTIAVQPQDSVRNHLTRVERASFGDYAESVLASEDAQLAQMEIARGNKLLPVTTAFYVRGAALGGLRENQSGLAARVHQVHSLLLSNNIRPILERDDLVPLDAYIRNLPMAYDHAFDRKETRRSRFVFARHIANLLPLYGRSTGTGNPGMLFFNRGGEPVQFDPIADRKSNAHMLILGPTGSGKSALLVYDLLMVMAVHRPRVFIIEAGGSFSLLGQYFASLGLAVNQVTMRPGEDVSLPPFADALKLAGILPQSKGQAQTQIRGQGQGTTQTQSNAMEIDREGSGVEEENADETPDREGEGRGEAANEAGRDLLGEMEISARLMITGGDAHEDARLTRADRWLIQQAILGAVGQVKSSGRGQVLTEDVAHALRAMAGERPRAKDMADALGHFCTPGSLAAHFFNRPGRLWPDADVTTTRWAFA